MTMVHRSLDDGGHYCGHHKLWVMVWNAHIIRRAIIRPFQHTTQHNTLTYEHEARQHTLDIDEL